MGISLVGTWKVILTDGTAAQMHLPGTLDESGIGHRDVGANQWHPDAALGNAEVLQNWCRSVPEDGSTSSWRVKQNWVRKRSTGTDQIRRHCFCKSFLVADRRTGTGDECTAPSVSVQIRSICGGYWTEKSCGNVPESLRNMKEYLERQRNSPDRPPLPTELV